MSAIKFCFFILAVCFASWAVGRMFVFKDEDAETTKCMRAAIRFALISYVCPI